MVIQLTSGAVRYLALEQELRHKERDPGVSSTELVSFRDKVEMEWLWLKVEERQMIYAYERGLRHG
jgi:hypothetical protein